MACRNDNRLVKTLLLAALVPKVPPFNGLTVKRLVHLNHGAVKAPVETMAINLAATRLRESGKILGTLLLSGPAALILAPSPNRRAAPLEKLFRAAGKLSAMFGSRYQEYAVIHGE